MPTITNMTTNYTKPHEATQSAVGYRCDDNHKTCVVTAYLSAYRVHRCYGGGEEGGWWYDAFEFLGASFPFRAEQDFDAAIADTEGYDRWEDSSGNICYWNPHGHPRVTDEPTRVRLQSVWLHLVEMYGQPGTDHRYSCAQREDDYAFVYELTPGALADRARPRYC